MITQERLKEVLHYCPDTGNFTRIKRTSNRVPSGVLAGSLVKSAQCKIKYYRIGIDRANYGAHRLAFLYMTGSMPKNPVDHIDGNGLNNKWTNLRLSTKQDNAKNCFLNKLNTSGTSGVTWSKKIQRWTSRIYINGKSTHIGCFKRKEDAIKCRLKAEKDQGYSERHGEPFPSTS